MPDGQHETASNLWGGAGKQVPAHVPPELVRSYSFYAAPGIAECPFHAVASLHTDTPPIFYNVDDPQCGSAWVLTRAADLRAVLANPAVFSSSNITGFSALMGETWPLTPLELDPPAHTLYRSLLNPRFSPSAIAAMSGEMRARAVNLIDGFAGTGGCSFMSAFGRPFPVGVFLQLMGLPAEESAQFLKWEDDLLNNLDMSVKVAAAAAIKAYLLALMADRRRAPVDDLASYVATATVQGRTLTDDEVLGIYYLLFVGGLDTVAASLGFYFRYLAENPAVQARLRADPALIPRAIEECLRAFSPVTTRRITTEDTELAGVIMKKGEWVTCVTALASLDPDAFTNPLVPDLDRTQVRHTAFGFGPHFCLGSHLAKREIQIAFEEWMARVPPFRMAPGFHVHTHGGPVMGVAELQLIWD
jgi:cytochrome P450